MQSHLSWGSLSYNTEVYPVAPLRKNLRITCSFYQIRNQIDTHALDQKLHPPPNYHTSPNLRSPPKCVTKLSRYSNVATTMRQRWFDARNLQINAKVYFWDRVCKIREGYALYVYIASKSTTTDKSQACRRTVKLRRTLRKEATATKDEGYWSWRFPWLDLLNSYRFDGAVLLWWILHPSHKVGSSPWSHAMSEHRFDDDIPNSKIICFKFWNSLL